MFKRLFALMMVVCLLSSQCVSVAKAASTFDESFYSGNDILFYDPRCASNEATGFITVNGKNNLEHILKFFMVRGLTLAQASGIAGNLMAESGLDPTIIQGGGHAKPKSGYVPSSGIGFGLAQWTSGNRQQGLVKYAGDHNVDVTDLDGQLNYLWQELSQNYSSTLTSLHATTTPLNAAVVFHNGYEGSSDSIAQVEANRGGNAEKFYQTYSDAPALAGSTAQDASNTSGDTAASPASATTTDGNPGSSSGETTTSNGCTPGVGSGDLLQTLHSYAWPTYKGNTTVATDDYNAAVQRAISQGRYVGGTSYPGIDCGGFVTTLLVDSGFDKNYNYGSYKSKGAGFTSNQEAWLKKNWQPISNTDASDRQPGDVAINDDHTYVYVGPTAFPNHKPIASASLNERAPMQGNESVVNVPGQKAFQWYRIKSVSSALVNV